MNRYKGGGLRGIGSVMKIVLQYMHDVLISSKSSCMKVINIAINAIGYFQQATKIYRESCFSASSQGFKALSEVDLEKFLRYLFQHALLRYHGKITLQYSTLLSLLLVIIHHGIIC